MSNKYSSFNQQIALKDPYGAFPFGGGRARTWAPSREALARAEPIGAHMQPAALFAPRCSERFSPRRRRCRRSRTRLQLSSRHGHGQRDAELRLERNRLQHHRRQLFVARRGRPVVRAAVLLVPLQGRRHLLPGHRAHHRRPRQRHGRRRRQTHAEHALAHQLLPCEFFSNFMHLD